MYKKFLICSAVLLFSSAVQAREIVSTIEDVTWDLFFIARPVSDEPDIPTETILLFTDVFPPTMASTTFPKCRVNKKILKPMEAELRKYVGQQITTVLEPGSQPVWLGEGYQATFVNGKHTFEDGKTLRDLLLSIGAAVADPSEAPSEWWKKPKCVNR